VKRKERDKIGELAEDRLLGLRATRGCVFSKKVFFTKIGLPSMQTSYTATKIRFRNFYEIRTSRDPPK
jgi:hypothetical protein